MVDHTGCSPPAGHHTRTSPLREITRNLVIREFTVAGPISQTELAARTKLSRATVASVVADLLDESIIVHYHEDSNSPPLTAVAPPGRGRPPRLLQIRPDSGFVAGIDFGHTHLAIALSDMSGRILAESRVDVDVDPSASSALGTAADMLQEMVGAQGAGQPAAVVMGIPGPIDLITGVLRSGTLLPGWVGIRPAAVFGKLINLPVTVENDANLGALGEMSFGAATGATDFLYVKVSSGIGAGVVINGRIYRGARGTAGEIGHVQVREDGALCRCGSRGCLETVSSTDAALSELGNARRQQVSVEQARGLIRAGDPGAIRLVTDMGTAIGRVIAAVSANLDPELVVVGGAIVDDPGPLLDGIAVAVRRYTQPYVSDTLRVVGGTLGSRAGVLGALAQAIANARELTGPTRVPN